MNAKQIGEAVRIAKDSEIELEACSHVFMGFGLNGFKAVYVTLKEVAALMRYQALMLNGIWDEESLQEVITHNRKFIIIDG